MRCIMRRIAQSLGKIAQNEVYHRFPGFTQILKQDNLCRSVVNPHALPLKFYSPAWLATGKR